MFDGVLYGTSTWSNVYAIDLFTDFGGRPQWLADSRRLLFIDSQKVYVLDSVTKRIKELYSAAPHRLQGITVSSDNRSINISLAINEADIWLASLK